MKIKKPSAKIVETIKARFNTPDEFITQYNAFLMSRLKDKDLIEWFNNLPEDELDVANNYYLVNERTKKFNETLKSLRRKCSTKAQRLAFNSLLKEFCNE